MKDLQIAAFFRTLWMELGYNLDLPIPLFMDNQSTRDIIGKSRVSDRSKYAEIQVHYVRERVVRGEVSPCWVSTDKMLADVFTEALPPFCTSLYAQIP
jgi:hypothetical protein